jgi:hypothetical protein
VLPAIQTDYDLIVAAGILTGTLGTVTFDGDDIGSVADWSIGTVDDQILRLSFAGTGIVPNVPEPASIAIWSFLGICLAGYGYRRRRRNS